MRRGAKACAASSAAAGALLALAACADLFGPSGEVRPEMRTLMFSSLLMGMATGVIDVMAVPADSCFRLEPDQRVPVELTTSSGDHESVALFRRLCPMRESSRAWNCFRFNVMMEAGQDVLSTRSRAAAAGAHVERLGICVPGACQFETSSGNVVQFSPDDLIENARAAHAWPGVQEAGLLFAFGVELPGGGGVTDTDRAVLMLPVRVDTAGAVQAGDGRLQLRFTDSVTVRYRQPSGATLAVTGVVLP